MGGHDIQYDANYYNGMTQFEEALIQNNTVINTLGDVNKDYRVPIGPDVFSSIAVASEFQIINKPDALIDVKRSSYKGKRELCCVKNINYYWDNLDGTNFKFIRNIDANYLQTCDPDCKNIAFSFCNDIHYQNCVVDRIKYNEYSSDLTPICSNWFYALYSQAASQNVIDTVNQKMYETCKNDMEQQYCKEWITGIRGTDNHNYNTLADEVLYNQTNKTKLNCVFTPTYILEQQNNFDVPYECWYAGCSDSPNVYLTQNNLKNRQKCYTYNCNINISEIKVPDETEINIICMNKRTQTAKEIIENKDKEVQNLYFPNLNYYICVFLIILFLTFFLFTFI